MTDQELQQKVLGALARVELSQILVHKQLMRLESAVLGNPAEGVDGLMTRMAVVEQGSGSSGKKLAATVGGAGTIGALLITVLDWVWTKLDG